MARPPDSPDSVGDAEKLLLAGWVGSVLRPGNRAPSRPFSGVTPCYWSSVAWRWNWRAENTFATQVCWRNGSVLHDRLCGELFHGRSWESCLPAASSPGSSTHGASFELREYSSAADPVASSITF